MKTLFMIIETLTVLLAVSLAAQQNNQPAPTDNAPQITYVANEGFLIQAGGKKVLVDALFEGTKDYLAPSQELLTRMTEGSGPFADVDILLVTHPHDDHFNPKLVVGFLFFPLEN
jgi:L-ascorbate metabolism protein UlaG (beta-lactamase superfamily)